MDSKTCQWECKNYHKCEKHYSWNPSTCICENSKYLKSVADTSVTECVEIVTVINNLSTKKTNTISTNVTNTASINCYSKKVRDSRILHIVLLAIILLLIITVICSLCKTKRYNVKWKIMNLKKFVLKIASVIISMT